jgi:hypothetical protein
MWRPVPYSAQKPSFHANAAALGDAHAAAVGVVAFEADRVGVQVLEQEVEDGPDGSMWRPVPYSAQKPSFHEKVGFREGGCAIGKARYTGHNSDLEFLMN